VTFDRDEEARIELLVDTDGLPDEFEEAFFRRIVGNARLAAHETGVTEGMVVRVTVTKRSTQSGRN
jgi:hypothetical protein